MYYRTTEREMISWLSALDYICPGSWHMWLTNNRKYIRLNSYHTRSSLYYIKYIYIYICLWTAGRLEKRQEAGCRKVGISDICGRGRRRRRCDVFLRSLCFVSLKWAGCDFVVPAHSFDWWALGFQPTHKGV